MSLTPSGGFCVSPYRLVVRVTDLVSQVHLHPQGHLVGLSALQINPISVSR